MGGWDYTDGVLSCNGPDCYPTILALAILANATIIGGIWALGKLIQWAGARKRSRGR